MDFELPDTAIAVRDGVAAVAAKYDNAYWSRCEEEHRFPQEAYDDLAAGGWIGLAVPEEYGGGGQGMLELAVANETLCASGGTAGTFFYVTTPGFGSMTLTRHGTEEQKQRILPGLATGESQFCLALTEPDAGSNAIEITTSARRDGDDFLIRGPEGLDLQRRAGRVDGRGHPHDPGRRRQAAHAGFTLFLVDVKEALAAGTPHLHADPEDGQQHPVTPARCSSTTCASRPRTSSARSTPGFGVLWDVLNPERILAAAGGVGSAQAALDVAVDYARERRVFGRPIGSNQAIQFPLAQIKAKTELGRLMTYKAAWLFDRACRVATRPTSPSSPAPRWRGRPRTRRSRRSAAWRTARSTRWSACSATPASARTSRSPRNWSWRTSAPRSSGLPKSY